ncbi:Fe-S cluster assembly ATPase SufC [candidate division WWE3 bacterium CG_4_9_14_3_um_filter_34_6]|uniref:Fe-S cluster assembly ATPase SufC n=1 Tax=candidate division WWE3 bacterium CG_4_9_14_3_um_filter_34_6 TaxID=1975079 RepID=A0A2M7X4L5_UNCKA|nr:MAG: Fe-S cluster assembly ATPase SufC [candidate division WWE3 bacterium CG_4_9_14_3_um_filter_34_6]
MLKIKNLKAKRDGKSILNGVNLEIEKGEIHALMGPNGSGKSTLAAAIMGHPDVEVDEKSIVTIDGQNLFEMGVDDRAKNGLFLAFQYPVEIPGVSFVEFLRLSYNSIQKHRQGDKFRELSPFKFKQYVEEKMKMLHMDTSFLDSNLNEGFSGGEKKKAEILQMAILEPKYAILDETDSGLDVSALKIVAEGAKILSEEYKIGILVITHYKRILEYLKPSHVHVLINGVIKKSGDYSLAEELDREGYKDV